MSKGGDLQEEKAVPGTKARQARLEECVEGALGAAGILPLVPDRKCTRQSAYPHFWHHCSLSSLLDSALKRGNGAAGLRSSNGDANLPTAAAVTY